jgi:hypothetical protein
MEERVSCLDGHKFESQPGHIVLLLHTVLNKSHHLLFINLYFILKVLTVAVVVTELQTMFKTQFVDMFIIYFHTKFHMPSTKG